MAWTELNGRRTQKAKHYYDSTTGKYQAVFTIHDQHYKDELNQWQDADESIVNDGTGGFDKKCEKTRHIFRVGTGGNYRWYPRRNTATEYVDITGIEYWRTTGGGSWRAISLPAAVWKQQSASWDMANLYAEIINTWKKVESSFILKDATAPTRLRFAISFTGLTYNDTTGELTSTTDGLVWGYITPPVAWYGNIDRELGTPLTVMTTYSVGYLEWSVDTTGAIFPVYVDPTFIDGYGGDVQTYFDGDVRENAADTSYATEISLAMRTGASIRSSMLLKFDLSSLTDVTITDADLYLYLHAYYSGGDAAQSVRRILAANSGWVEACTWNYADGAGASDRWAGDVGNNGGTDAGCSVSGTDYSGTAMGSFTVLATDVAGTEYISDIDGSEFDSMVAANYGIILIAGNFFTLRSSDHATTGNRPKLVVSYTEGVPPTTITVTVVDFC